MASADGRRFASVAGEWLELWPGAGSKWEVYFGNICLGTLDEDTGPARFQPTRRPRKATMRLAYASE